MTVILSKFSFHSLSQHQPSIIQAKSTKNGIKLSLPDISNDCTIHNVTEYVQDTKDKEKWC